MEYEYTNLAIKDFLERYSDEKRTLLDVGCGDAYIAKKYIIPIFTNILYTGLDSYYWDDDQKSIVLPVDSRVRYVYGDATSMEFVDGTFDLVIATHVLEHIPQIEKACKEISRVLRKDGYALIVVPVEAGFWGSIFRAKHFAKNIRIFLNFLGIKKFKMTSPHVHFQTHEGWKSLFSKHFLILEDSAYGSLSMIAAAYFHYFVSALTRNKISGYEVLERISPSWFHRSYGPNKIIKLGSSFIVKNRAR